MNKKLCSDRKGLQIEVMSARWLFFVGEEKKNSHYVTTISGSLSFFDWLSYDQNIKD